MNSMELLQNDIADTISIPNSLRHLEPDCQDAVWILLNIIYTRCIHEDFMSEREILVTQLEVEDQSEDIKKLCDPNDFFLIWQWIGTTCVKWLRSSIKHQEFESATNLKKVLHLDE